MATRRTTDVEKGLLNKGMERDESHHHMFRKTIDGTTQIVTRTSHGSREIGNDLGKRMGAQCYLQLKEFWSLIDCPLTEPDWEALVRQRSEGGQNPFLGH